MGIIKLIINNKMFVNNMIRTSKSMSMLGMANRSMLTVANKTYLAPEGLDDVMNHLDALKPTYTLLYFTASWNPICANMRRITKPSPATLETGITLELTATRPPTSRDTL